MPHERPGLLEQDNYGVALSAAAERLRSCDLAVQARRAGGEAGPEGVTLRYFDEAMLARPEPGRVSRASDGAELPLFEQILVLHYLLGAPEGLGAGLCDWVAFRELPDAAFYEGAFRQQVAAPLAARFGEAPAELTALAGRWGSAPGQGGDASLVIPAFPQVHLAFQVWSGDEDFGAEATVLFSRSAGRCLTAEDAAVLADVALRRVLDASGPR